jgi:geranylgeranyl diphosphate synthase type I
MTAPHDTFAGSRPPDAPPPILSDARRLVLPSLRDAVDGLHPDLARLCGYHFGWYDRDGRPAGNGRGKFLRAALVLLSARAAGPGPRETGDATDAETVGNAGGTADTENVEGTADTADTAVPGAVAVELVHNFSLLHDDIMDADERRRGRPAAWVVFGTNQAILAGDALTALAVGRLTALRTEVGRAAAGLLVDSLNEMIGGQAADLALEGLPAARATVEHYVAATYKTTALLSCCAGIGAGLAGAPADRTEALREAARRLGLSWQMANDIEDIWGDPAITGKPAFSDLRHAKKTLPVIVALRSGTRAGALLAEALQAAGTEPGEEDLRKQAALIEQAGGRDHTQDLSRRYLDRAVARLREALPPSEARDELTRLFRFIVTRETGP